MPTAPTGISPPFSEIFGRSPEHYAQAPGRINLIGEHVDYQDGLVMPAAIDRYVFAEAAVNDRSELRIWSSLRKGPAVSYAIETLAPSTGNDSWTNYVTGVVAKYQQSGIEIPGFDIAFNANLPLGAGLSSSAALESSTALIIESITGTEKSVKERALLCQGAEHDFAGVPCGIMDQLAVNGGITGHALSIDCRSLEISPSPIPDDLAIVVVDSRVKHALADGEYAKRKGDCDAASAMLGVDSLRETTMEAIDSIQDKLGDRIYRRARHVVTEIERVRLFANALRDGDLDNLGKLMAASHASLRDDYEVSCSELDHLVIIANSVGAVGSRMMGGGFGGSTVNLVRADQASSIAESIRDLYLKNHGADVEAFVVHAVDGAAFLPFRNNAHQYLD